MTDFYAQLEDQLVSASRRRQTQGRARRAVAGRGRALIAATAVVAALAAGAAVALPQLRTTATTSTPAAPVAPVPAPVVPPPAATVPSRGGSLAGIRVAVLNGTTLTGLARDVADELRRRDARIAGVGSAVKQDVTGTVVLYRSGARAKARRVAAVLGGVAVRPSGASPDGRAAEIVVVVGIAGRPAPSSAAPVPATPKGATAVPPAATVPLPAPARPAAPPAATPARPAPVPAATVPAPAAVPVPPRTTAAPPRAP